MAARTVSSRRRSARPLVAAIRADGSGMCRYNIAGLDDLARATVALAPAVWIGAIRGDRYARGTTGTAQDHRHQDRR